MSSVDYQKKIDNYNHAIVELKKKINDNKCEISDFKKENCNYKKRLIDTREKDKNMFLSLIEINQKSIKSNLKMIEINENRVSELKKELQEFEKKLNDSSNNLTSLKTTENICKCAQSLKLTSNVSSSESFNITLSPNTSCCFSQFDTQRGVEIIKEFNLESYRGLFSQWKDALERQGMQLFQFNTFQTDKKTENEAIFDVKKYLMDQLNLISHKFSKKNLEDLGFRLVTVNNSKNPNFSLSLPNGSKGRADLAIFSNLGNSNQSNFVNIEYKLSKELIYENYGQSIAQLISANIASKFPVLQLTSDMKSSFEIRLLTKRGSEFGVIEWCLESADEALSVIAFWLKYVCAKEIFSGTTIPEVPNLDFLKGIYEAHQEIQRKAKIFELKKIEKFEFEKLLNTMRNNYNYSNFNERCIKWLNSDYILNY